MTVTTAARPSKREQFAGIRKERDFIPAFFEEITMKKIFYHLKMDVKRHFYIYLMLIPVIAFYVIFCYAPMGGAIIAFKDFSPRKGIWGSDWVGFQYFQDFFSDMYFGRLMSNTFILNVIDIIVGFPLPILLALLLNELTSRKFKGVVQTTLYMPNFISLIVLCGIVIDFCATEGVVNQVLGFFGVPATNWMQEPSLFKPIFVASNAWQYAGWSSIIYVAALSGIDQELYDAAEVDGCNRWRKMWSVTLPAILPTIVIMFVLRMGNIMTVGFEKVILLYNPLTYETADVISSYVYRRGILEANYSYATAVGLFNSVLNFGFLWFANLFSRKVTDQSLW